MLDELPRLTNENDWLDLAEGDHAILVGSLDTAQWNFLLVSFPDWSLVSVDIEGKTTAAARPPRGSRVELEVIRTEDGLKTNHELILKAKHDANLGSSY